MIPKILHQTWKTSEIPDRFRAFAASWKRHHPGWEFRLWDDNDNRAFIQNQHAWFLPIYDNYSFDIQRADAVRYFILYTYGGLYVDLDYECLQAVDGLFEGKTCVLATEAQGHCAEHGVDRIISNAFMACTPKHTFMYSIMKHLVTYISHQTRYDRFVLDTTGPFMLNRAFSEYPDQGEISLIASKYLSPLTYEEAETWIQTSGPESIEEKLKHAYAAHYHIGTWWR